MLKERMENLLEASKVIVEKFQTGDEIEVKDFLKLTFQASLTSEYLKSLDNE